MQGAVYLLPLIDYAGFSARPKLFMGPSDVSLLVLALHARTDVVTFHGPTGMDFGSLPPYSDAAMHAALTATEPLGELPAFGRRRALRGDVPAEGACSAATWARSAPCSARLMSPTGTARSSTTWISATRRRKSRCRSAPSPASIPPSRASRSTDRRPPLNRAAQDAAKSFIALP